MKRALKQLSLIGALGGILAALLLLLVPANSAEADRSFRQLVLDDCAKAKEQLPLQERADQAGIVDYLVDVIHLKFPNKIPPFSPPQFVNKWQDAGPSKIEAPYIDPARVDPLRVTESAAERNARNCAVELLGMMGEVASTALPDLVEYASQGELDDQSRNRAQEALYAVATASRNNVAEETLRRLVKALAGAESALSRSVLMIVAPAHWQVTIDLAVTESLVGVSDASSLLSELFEAMPELVVPEIAKILRGDDALGISRALEILSILKLAPAPLISVVEDKFFASLKNEPGALNFEPQIQRSAAEILMLSGDICAGVSASSFERAVAFIDWEGIIGNAALQRMRCAMLERLVASPRVDALRRSENPLVRERAVHLASILPGRSALSVLTVLTEDPILSVRVSAINELSKVGVEQRNQAVAVLLKILTPISKSPISDDDRVIVKSILSVIDKLDVRLGWQSWGPVLKRLVLSYGAESKFTVAPSSGQLELSKVLNLLGRQGLEIPKALLRSSKPEERLTAANLIALASGANPQALSLLVPLLGDENSEVRGYVFAILASERVDLLPPIIKQAIGSKQTLVRGAGLILHPGSFRPEQLKVAEDWISQSSCLELLLGLSQPALNQEQLYQIALPRVPKCLSELGPEWSERVVSVWGGSKVDPRRRELLLKSLTELEPEHQLRVAVIKMASELGLSSQELVLLSKSSLEEIAPEQAISLLPTFSRYGNSANELSPQLRNLRGRFPMGSQERCAVVDVLSQVDQEFDWLDYFKDELGQGEEGVGCLGAVNPSSASEALIKLLPEVPLRKQIRILRRLAVVEGLSLPESLRDFLTNSLGSANEELRCLSTKVAVHSGYVTPLTQIAVRRSLYGPCWEYIKGYVDPNLARIAVEIEKSPGNNLELTRASYLQKINGTKSFAIEKK